MMLNTPQTHKAAKDLVKKITQATIDASIGNPTCTNTYGLFWNCCDDSHINFCEFKTQSSVNTQKGHDVSLKVINMERVKFIKGIQKVESVTYKGCENKINSIGLKVWSCKSLAELRCYMSSKSKKYGCCGSDLNGSSGFMCFCNFDTETLKWKNSNVYTYCLDKSPNCITGLKTAPTKDDITMIKQRCFTEIDG